MKKLLLAAAAALWMTGAAAATCTQETSGLLLKLPNYGDRGDVWAKCVRDNFDLLNDVVLSTSSGANFVLSSAPVLTGGLTSSSWANFASSVAVAGGFYGSGAGLTSVPSSSLVGAIPTALVDLSTVTTALSGKVSKTGDTMSGQLTTISSMTAQHLMLNQYANPSITFQGNNVNNGGLIQYLQSDGDLAWKLWHNPSLADDLYLYSYLDGLRAVQAWKQNGDVGVGTVSPTHKFHVVGGVVATSSITATEGFYGDGSGLSGVIQSTATGTYALRVATATYLATAPGACSAGEFINALTADGTKTCAAPAGGGDMILAATQTVTGAKIYESSVTIDGSIFFSNVFISSSTTIPAWNGAQTNYQYCLSGSTLTLTTHGNSRLEIKFAGTIDGDTNGATHYITPIVDGAWFNGGILIGINMGGQAASQNASFVVETDTLPAGIHTVCLALAASVGQTYIKAAGGTGFTNRFTIREIP